MENYMQTSCVIMLVPIQMKLKWLVKWLMTVKLFPHLKAWSTLKSWLFSLNNWMSQSTQLRTCGIWRCVLQQFFKKSGRHTTLNRFFKKAYTSQMKCEIVNEQDKLCTYKHINDIFKGVSRGVNCEWNVTDKMAGQLTNRVKHVKIFTYLKLLWRALIQPLCVTSFKNREWVGELLSAILLWPSPTE